MDVLECYWQGFAKKRLLIGMLHSYDLHPEWLENETKKEVYRALSELYQKDYSDIPLDALKELCPAMGDLFAEDFFCRVAGWIPYDYNINITLEELAEYSRREQQNRRMQRPDWKNFHK